MERRPLYIVQLEELDENYVYSKRILEFDQEMFVSYHAEMYDQKGRLWRAYNILYGHTPEIGIFWWLAASYFDHIDVHSTLEQDFTILSLNSDREEFSAKRLMRGPK